MTTFLDNLEYITLDEADVVNDPASHGFSAIVMDPEANAFKVVEGRFENKKDAYERLTQRGYVVRKVLETPIFDWIKANAADNIEAYAMFSTAFSKWRGNNMLNDDYERLLNDIPQLNREKVKGNPGTIGEAVSEDGKVIIEEPDDEFSDRYTLRIYPLEGGRRDKVPGKRFGNNVGKEFNNVKLLNDRFVKNATNYNKDGTFKAKILDNKKLYSDLYHWKNEKANDVEFFEIEIFDKRGEYLGKTIIRSTTIETSYANKVVDKLDFYDKNFGADDPDKISRNTTMIKNLKDLNTVRAALNNVIIANNEVLANDEVSNTEKTVAGKDRKAAVKNYWNVMNQQNLGSTVQNAYKQGLKTFTQKEYDFSKKIGKRLGQVTNMAGLGTLEDRVKLGSTLSLELDKLRQLASLRNEYFKALDAHKNITRVLNNMDLTSEDANEDLLAMLSLKQSEAGMKSKNLVNELKTLVKEVLAALPEKRSFANDKMFFEYEKGLIDVITDPDFTLTQTGIEKFPEYSDDLKVLYTNFDKMRQDAKFINKLNKKGDAVKKPSFENPKFSNGELGSGMANYIDNKKLSKALSKQVMGEPVKLKSTSSTLTRDYGNTLNTATTLLKNKSLSIEERNTQINSLRDNIDDLKANINKEYKTNNPDKLAKKDRMLNTLSKLENMLDKVNTKYVDESITYDNYGADIADERARNSNGFATSHVGFGPQGTFVEDKTHETLNPAIFEGDTIIPEVRDALLDIAIAFKESLDLNTEPKDVYLTGSCANYNYNENSDLDVHLVYDYEKVGVTAEILSKYLVLAKKLFNANYDLTVNGLPVEVGCENINEPLVTTGIYSLLKNKWVVDPVNKDKEVPDVDMELYDEYVQKIQKAIESGSPARLKDLRKEISKMRKDSLADEGEFGAGNLVFKKLRGDNALATLYDAYLKAISNELSFENVLEEDSLSKDTNATDEFNLDMLNAMLDGLKKNAEEGNFSDKDALMLRNINDKVSTVDGYAELDDLKSEINKLANETDTEVSMEDEKTVDEIPATPENNINIDNDNKEDEPSEEDNTDTDVDSEVDLENMDKAFALASKTNPGMFLTAGGKEFSNKLTTIGNKPDLYTVFEDKMEVIDVSMNSEFADQVEIVPLVGSFKDNTWEEVTLSKTKSRNINDFPVIGGTNAGTEYNKGIELPSYFKNRDQITRKKLFNFSMGQMQTFLKHGIHPDLYFSDVHLRYLGDSKGKFDPAGTHGWIVRICGVTKDKENAVSEVLLQPLLGIEQGDEEHSDRAFRSYGKEFAMPVEMFKQIIESPLNKKVMDNFYATGGRSEDFEKEAEKLKTARKYIVSEGELNDWYDDNQDILDDYDFTHDELIKIYKLCNGNHPLIITDALKKFFNMQRDNKESLLVEANENKITVTNKNQLNSALTQLGINPMVMVVPFTFDPKPGINSIYYTIFGIDKDFKGNPAFGRDENGNISLDRTLLIAKRYNENRAKEERVNAADVANVAPLGGKLELNPWLWAETLQGQKKPLYAVRKTEYVQIPDEYVKEMLQAMTDCDENNKPGNERIDFTKYWDYANIDRKYAKTVAMIIRKFYDDMTIRPIKTQLGVKYLGLVDINTGKPFKTSNYGMHADKNVYQAVKSFNKAQGL